LRKDRGGLRREAEKVKGSEEERAREKGEKSKMRTAVWKEKGGEETDKEVFTAFSRKNRGGHKREHSS